MERHSVTEDVAVDGSGNLSAVGALTLSNTVPGQPGFMAQPGTAGTNGYGTFTLAADGSWTYTANDSQTAIQRLGAGQSITEAKIPGLRSAAEVMVQSIIDTAQAAQEAA